MGQKAFKNSSPLTFTGSYPTHGAYESDLLGPFSKTIHAAEPIPASPDPCRTGQSFCEFKDFCNHLYYIKDRCDCAFAWKRMSGLVLPTSI